MNKNREHNIGNPYQGTYTKTLCVCSAGLLRSPTMAWLLSQPPYNHNVRAVGTDESFALICLDEALLIWADLILCSDDDSYYKTLNKVKEYDLSPKRLESIFNLHIKDSYEYRNETLINILTDKFNKMNLPYNK